MISTLRDFDEVVKRLVRAECAMDHVFTSTTDMRELSAARMEYQRHLAAMIEPWDDKKIEEVVNKIRDIAVMHHDRPQYLRNSIARVLVPALKGERHHE